MEANQGLFGIEEVHYWDHKNTSNQCSGKTWTQNLQITSPLPQPLSYAVSILHALS